MVSDLGAAAPDLNRIIEGLGPFSQAGIPALASLGEAGESGIPDLQASLPVIKDTRALAKSLAPVAPTLAGLLASFQRNDGIERAMDFLLYGVAATNGFDALGHYLRAGLIVNQCTSYATRPVPGCTANFRPVGTASAAATGQVPVAATATPAPRAASAAAAAAAGRRRGRAAARLPVRERRLMRGRGGIAGNPVLIGAATVLVIIVAVFLSYNANQGLPFVARLHARRPRRRAPPTSCAATRCGSAARASAPSTRSPPSAGPTGPASPCSASSSSGPPSRCRATRPCWSGRARRSASSTSSSRAGRRTRASRTATRSRSPTPRRPRSSSTTSSTCSTSRPAPRSRPTCAASATRSPAAAPASTRRSARWRRCCATSSPWPRT